ncbi:MAG: hypothetical protein EX269_09935 [Acidimicrobiales bacterium]|nr:MAG: hypothetical protein EX269_09935 [Acidimicrobiales bacterium]
MWGALTAVIGVLFVVWGRAESDFVVYRLLAARSRILWGDGVHNFYQVVGIILIVVGVLIAVFGS